MKNSVFTSVKNNVPNANTFDLSHQRAFSTQVGLLTPCCVMETIPGGYYDIQSRAVIKLAPLKVPPMTPITGYIHYFFVANRIVFADPRTWEDFMTGGEDGGTFPWAYVPYQGSAAAEGDLEDYMGLPVAGDGNTTDIDVNAIPFAAYQKIYHDYYRDQNIIPEFEDDFLLDAGDNSLKPQLLSLRKRAWMHDYFTSALPTAQKGPEALLPLGTTAPIFAQNSTTDPLLNEQKVRKQTTAGLGTAGAMNITGSSELQDGGASDAYIDLQDSHLVDLSQATSASITDLRRAMKLQEYLERNNRGGTRYIEWIKVHYNVNSSDKRMQRPEYIGGVSVPINISEVLQTSSVTTQPTATGQPYGHGIGVAQSKGYGYFAEEHGYIIGIFSVMPKTAYQQGIPRHFLKNDKFEYHTPEFEHIGEQAIWKEELYADTSDPRGTFGYVPRYSDYKFINDSVHGDFRSSLDFWQAGRQFSSEPNLNQTFIECKNDDIKRIFNVNDEDRGNIWVHLGNQINARLPMAYFGEPKM